MSLSLSLGKNKTEHIQYNFSVPAKVRTKAIDKEMYYTECLPQLQPSGIVLCSETDADIARYSILKGSEQLFATKYKLFLPSEEELRTEIERQKLIFKMQQTEA